MPGTGLQTLSHPPAVVFVTAHADHAVSAFELDAVDYLTKAGSPGAPATGPGQGAAGAGHHPGRPGNRCHRRPARGETLVIQDRGRTERVPLVEVLFLKAEQKYVTVRTTARSYILDGSLNELEARYPGQFLRIHRNALVARRAVRAPWKSTMTPMRGKAGPCACMAWRSC